MNCPRNLPSARMPLSGELNNELAVLASEEHDVNVCSQPDIKSQVPTHMVGVVIDYDLVLIP